MAHYSLFFFNDTATTEIYTLSLHDALPICCSGDIETGLVPRVFVAAARRDVARSVCFRLRRADTSPPRRDARSEEHTSELQSQSNLVCRLLLEQKNTEAHGEASTNSRRSAR